MKCCSVCKIEKDGSEFHKHPTASQGLLDKCKTCHNAACKSNYTKNKQAYIDRAKAWAVNNRQKRREIVNKYDNENREVIRLKNREHNKKKRILNPAEERENGKHYSHIRRARVNSVKSTLTIEDEKYILSVSKGLCIYCNQTSDKLTLDHFLPISKGGHNKLMNIVPCCKSCNSSKSSRNGYDWLIKNNNMDAIKRVELFLKKSKRNQSSTKGIVVKKS